MKRWLVIALAALVLGFPLVLIVMDLKALESQALEDHEAILAALAERDAAAAKLFAEFDRQHAEDMKLLNRLETKLLNREIWEGGMPPLGEPYEGPAE